MGGLGLVKMSVQLAITLFILFPSIGLFLLSFLKKDFSANEYLNNIFKRGCLVLGLFLMMLNGAVMYTMGQGMGVNNELLRYMWFYGFFGNLFLGYLVLMMFLDLRNFFKVKKQKKRMGDYD